MDNYEDYNNKYSGYHDSAEDQEIPTLKDLRKTKLTLAHINKLRRMHDVREFEVREKIKKIKQIYGAKSNSEEL